MRKIALSFALGTALAVAFATASLACQYHQTSASTDTTSPPQTADAQQLPTDPAN